MPIHLPTLSRRDFLRRSLMAGAALAASPGLLAAARRTDSSSVALLADTHIAADRARVVREVNMTRHLQTVTQELLELPRRPAGVFILGDCAFSSGEKEDYATLTELLTPLQAGGLPLHLALGNHDHRENFWEALRDGASVQRPMVDRHVAVVSTAHVNWFMLDSLEKTLQTPGLLGQAQFDWLARTLDANRRKPAVILVHHNPGTGENNTGLKDTAALFEITRPRKQVKAWIFGHTHQWSVTEDSSGIHLVNLPPVAYIFRQGNPSGWVRATTRRDGLRLVLRSLDASHPQHGQVLDLKWRAG
jgi:Icc protein